MIVGGCEPLRQKFVRKKKAGAKDQVEVILDPIDYAPRVQDPARDYRYLFGLWVVWHKDLMTAMEENGSNKRLTGLSDEMLALMDRMEKLLTGPARDALTRYRAQLDDYRGLMGRPPAMRDNRQLELNLERLGRDMRRELTYDRVAEDIVPSGPARGSEDVAPAPGSS